MTPEPKPPGGIARRFSSACSSTLRAADAASARRIRAVARLERRVDRARRSLQEDGRAQEALKSRLDAAYRQALANRSNANVDAYNTLVDRFNARVRGFNARVAAANATIRKLNAIVDASNTAATRYVRTRDRCLRHIGDWDAATSELATTLATAAASSGPVTPSIICDPQSRTRQRGGFERLGYVDDDQPTTIHLAASTCLGLERAAAEPNALRCVERDNRRFLNCPFGVADAAGAIVTLAHEEQHVDGTLNEAKAQCSAYQTAAGVARGLGIREQSAAKVGPFIAQTGSMPRAYRSNRCHSGSRWDLHEPDAPPRWSYPGS